MRLEGARKKDLGLAKDGKCTHSHAAASALGRGQASSRQAGLVFHVNVPRNSMRRHNQCSVLSSGRELRDAAGCRSSELAPALCTCTVPTSGYAPLLESRVWVAKKRTNQRAEC